VYVAESGTLKVDVLASQVRLQDGQNKLLDTDGAALLIHAKLDDYHSQPSGDAGDCIACGVINLPTS
jgi:superoxide dismutase, Cu-Zn family